LSSERRPYVGGDTIADVWTWRRVGRHHLASVPVKDRIAVPVDERDEFCTSKSTRVVKGDRTVAGISGDVDTPPDNAQWVR
jgi:hypothetical protein